MSDIISSGSGSTPAHKNSADVQSVLRAFIILAAVAVFILLGVDVTNHNFPWYDVAAMHYFHAHQTPVEHVVMRWVLTELGGTALITGLTVIGTLYFIKKGRFKPDGLVLVLAIVLGLGLMEGMKLLFPRPRAFHVDDHLGSSFPSGHVFFAMTLYGLFAYWLTRDKPLVTRIMAWTLVVVFALLVGYSRVYVGAHYPTDVGGGFAMSIPWLNTWINVLERRRNRPLAGHSGQRAID